MKLQTDCVSTEQRRRTPLERKICTKTVRQPWNSLHSFQISENPRNSAEIIIFEGLERTRGWRSQRLKLNERQAKTKRSAVNELEKQSNFPLLSRERMACWEGKINARRRTEREERGCCRHVLRLLREPGREKTVMCFS